MNKRSILVFFASHGLACAIGFVGGIYLLPILIAPDTPSANQIDVLATSGDYIGSFSRDRKDSDVLHWGEGEFAIGKESVSFKGSLAPGPDYKLYLSPEFVETEADFKRLKDKMALVNDIKTFDGFIARIPSSVDPSKYDAAIVWCESFGQFITSGTYRRRDE